MIQKFRVAFKNKILGEIGSIDFIDETVTIPVYDKVDGEYLGDSVLGLNQVTIMQSTGLFDNSTPKKEIFEGDIVKVTDDDGRTDFSDGGNGTICGLDDLYMWYIDGQVQNGLFDINQEYYIEVIGNVYEHNHLLK